MIDTSITLERILESTNMTTKAPRNNVFNNTVEFDDGCKVLVINNYLESKSTEKYDEMLEYLVNVERYQGPSVFGSIKPRYEVSYTLDGKPNKYDGSCK